MGGSIGQLSGCYLSTIQNRDTKKELNKLNSWLAGIIDGDGYIQVGRRGEKKVLKSIQIKLHNRDIGILENILKESNVGRIIPVKKKPYSIYVVSKKEEMIEIIMRINGEIRLKVKSFRDACDYLNIEYIEPNYELKPFDPYLSGLVDTDGSIIFNYNLNRIECNLELKQEEYSSKLCLDKVIPNYKPVVYQRKKKNQTPGKVFNSIALKYQTVGGMGYLYDYFKENELYCNMKYYRVMKIKEFLEIRHYRNYQYDSEEFKRYSRFVLDWIQYENPKWEEVPFVKYLNKER